MPRLLKPFLFLAVVIAATGAGFKLAQPYIATTVMKRMAIQNAGVDSTDDLPDGLHVFICGAGSPMPDAKRAGPCTGIVAGERVFIVDAGGGSIANLSRMGFPMSRLDRALITHLHSDHIDGLGELLLQSWINGNRKTPTPVYGPEGIGRVVAGFNTAYQIDSTYREAHHGKDVADIAGFGGTAHVIDIDFLETVILDEGDLRITAFSVKHNPVEPAFGYRFDYKDRSVTLSGDTVFHPGLVSVAKDSDLLIHEALNIEMVEILRGVFQDKGMVNIDKILFDIQDYHATPVDAARAAQSAGAGTLVLNHIVPPLPSKLLEPLFLKGTGAEFDGPISVAEDGQIFSLPAGETAINTLTGFRL